MAVNYLGEVPGQGTLGGNSFAVQTKAMDLTSREDLQKANRWEGNVRLIVGVVRNPSTAQEEDPFHFRALAAVDVPSTSSPVRPVIFAAFRHFETMTEAKAYTSSSEHAQLQTMMRSLQAAAATGGTTNNTPTPTATKSGPS